MPQSAFLRSAGKKVSTPFRCPRSIIQRQNRAKTFHDFFFRGHFAALRFAIIASADQIAFHKGLKRKKEGKVGGFLLSQISFVTSTSGVEIWRGGTGIQAGDKVFSNAKVAAPAREQKNDDVDM